MTEAAPPLQRVATLVTGRRYLLLSVLATGVALASTYQRLLLGPTAPLTALLENSTTAADAASAVMLTPSTDSDSDIAPDSVPDSDVLTLTGFAAELMRSRVSAAIVMHLYSVVLYHIFLVVAHASFGAIRPSEIQQTKETVIHFALMRCLLLASTMGGAGQKTKMAVLLVWLSAVAFLHGIQSLCGARFEHLLTRPMTQLKDLHRLAFVLGGVLASDLLLATACSLLSVFSPLVVHFAWFEASLLLIRTLQLGTKVAFHVFDVGGSSVEFGSEKSEFYLLVLQTALSGCYLVQLVFYYLYIISVDQFRVSFLDFILLINVKNATVHVLENVKKVKMYHQVVMDLDRQFPDATQEELNAVADDVCVICLKSMDAQAKKLHCGHLFHRFCLRQCLQKASIGDAFTGLDAPVVARMGNGLDFDAAGAAGQQRAANPGFRCPICRKHVHPEKPEPAPLAPPAPPVLDPAFPPVDAPSPRAVDAHLRDDGAADLGRVTENDAGAAESDTEEVIRFSTEFISRYVPFPNFSFEIVRHRDGGSGGGGGGGAFAVTPEMVQHVWEVFPQYSAESIHADLTHTRSPERTIERILNGRFAAQRDEEGADRGDFARVLEDFDEDLRWRLS